MEIRVDKLRDTLKLLSPVTPKKTTLPILKSILLTDGKAVATDLTTSVVLDLLEIDGKCLIPVAEVLELLKYVPGNEKVTIDTTSRNLHLSWDGGKAAYPVGNPADYPEAVPSDQPMLEKEADGGLIVKVLNSMVSYAATDESRPVLTGVALYLGEHVAAAAGDGFRMVYDSLPLSLGTEGTAIIPTSSIQILNSLWDKVPVTAQLSSSLIQQITAKRKLVISLGDGKDNTIPTWIAFQFGRTKVIVKLISGNPPDFKTLIPVPTKKVQVMAPEFERAVLRVKDIARDSSGIVRLVWTDSEMTVSAKSEENGEAEAVISVNAEDGPGRFGINVNYLVEYLNGKDSLVTFGVTTESAPILFQYPNCPKTVIMPMMVQW